MDNLQNNILQLLSMGFTGSVDDFFSWARLYSNLEDYSLPPKNPKLSNLVKKFSQDFVKIKNISKDKVQAALEQLNFLEMAEYIEKYKYFAPSFSKLTIPKNNAFLAHRDSSFSGIQMSRSVFFNLLCSLPERRNRCENFAIAITEAIENAIKFSTSDLIAIDYAIKTKMNRKILFVYIINAVEEIGVEASAIEEKFSESKSLMRGILMMNSLLDEMEIQHNEEWGQMEFSCSYKLSSHV